MFPIAHYYVNAQIFGHVPTLMALGGLWPDLAGFCVPSEQRRAERDRSHVIGHDFHNWCLDNAPQMLDLARGVASHGTNPGCVDYYADEFWPGFSRGRCFMLGERYKEDVGRVTGLSEDRRWWKAHNFVEMGYDMLLDERCPQLKHGLLEALADEQTLAQAAVVLHEYSGHAQERIIEAFRNVPQLFAIANVSAEELCVKQARSLRGRFPGCTPDEQGMIELLLTIRHDLEQLGDDFPSLLVERTREQIAGW